jgi:PAS domain S-box-containing protein
MLEEANRRNSYRRSEDLYRKSIEEVRDYAIFVTDVNGRVVNWNRGAERILGYSEPEILGQDAEIFFTPEDRALGEPEREIATAAALGRAEDERWHLRRDQTRFWASGVLNSIRDEAGNLLGFTKVMRDMTEPKRLEAERDRFFTLSMDMLCIVRLEGRFDRVNPAFEKLLGFTEQELLALPVFDFIHPEDRPATEAEYEKLRHGEPTILLENRFLCKDGGYKWVAWSYFPVPEDGLAYGVGRDMTQLRRMNQALQARAEELEEANRVKDEFLAILSHELRTPLTSILGWSRLLRAGQLKEFDRHRAVQIIERNAEAQAKLIEDLLDVSRIITGKLKMDFQPVPFAPIVENVVSELLPAASAKKLEVDLAVDPDAGPILGDPTRLQQIVTNIFANAVKFTPERGRISVRLGRIDSHARLRISDTGAGISPNVLPHIFERFKQADSSNVRVHGGLGLGLAIVHHLVQQHAGVVRAESAGEGQGSTFIVDFPLAEVITSPSAHVDLFSEDVQLAMSRGESFTPDSMDLQDVRVLLVEDEPDTRELLTTILMQCGAAVTIADSAAAALSALDHAVPDVIVSDIGMPGANGYDLIRAIRSLPDPIASVPAVALTAYAGASDRRRALTSGFQTHLAKPVEPDELLAVIASLGKRLGRSSDADSRVSGQDTSR